ncbi:MAG: hypothetical protein LC105_04625 [Chitinophagales bacterium]|nr:hypothetical protein [Chitinophagales bacterium]MCZ2393127.1 hypothetical protein [Chitinophagales bacterium]
MKKWLNILWIILSISSCKKDDINNKIPTISLKILINTEANGQAVKKGNSYLHLSSLGYKVNELKYYISHIRLVNHQGIEFPFAIDPYIEGSEQGVFLYWIGKNESTSGTLPAQKYEQIKFDLGLSPTLNNLNPNQFSATHPLSRDTDMFWDMLKYRFLIFEGTLDKENNGTYSLPFSYHLGGNDFLRNITLDIPIDLSSQKAAILPIKFNLDKLFTDGNDTIDILKFFSYHSIDDQKNKGLKMMDFSANAFEK